ncbi:MAG: hypothetical protein DMD49_11500 [Gemmatimonadetes bacterium]|nr:MAG: hypothetical protein DMD49_11500 [Gemmatimonadota bacterium]
MRGNVEAVVLAERAPRYVFANARSSSMVLPEAVARSSRDVAASTARSSSKPTVCSRTNASSTPPSSIRIFKVPRTNARSPPVWMEKNASAIFVPKIALSTLEGTQ